MSYQKITVVGRVGKDLELNPAKTVGKTSMAADCGYGEHKSTTWFNLVMFGKMAESASRHMVKGKEFLVTGEMKQGSYENKEGVKVNTMELIVDKWCFVGSKDDSGVSRRSTVEAKADMNSIDDIDVPF